MGHNRLATVFGGMIIGYICGMNTRDTAAAMDDSMKAKMQKVGRVFFNSFFMIETRATIIAIILNLGMIPFISCMIHCWYH